VLKSDVFESLRDSLLFVVDLSTRRVEIDGMRTILRCSFDRALIRVGRVKGRYWLDMRDVNVLQIDASAT
jgi:hypothetical protein